MSEGLLRLAVATALLVLPLAVVFYQHEIGRLVRRLVHRPDSSSRAAPHPIGDLAADLRRLEAEYRRPPVGQPMAVRRGVQKALDDALVEACQALDVPDTLSGAPVGPQRDEQRELVIDKLQAAGLRVRAPA